MCLNEIIGDVEWYRLSVWNEKVQDFGKLYAYTYDQLVRTAEKRFFNLKSKLEEHYSQFNGDDYVKAILNEPEQLRLPGV